MWYETAIVTSLLLVGQILFARFEIETPRWRMLVKNAVGTIFFVGVAYFFGRFWFWLVIAATFLLIFIIHAWWLPKNGINGWTGEPRDKYYRLRGWKID